MKKSLLLFTLLSVLSFTGRSAIFTITNSGSTFTPNNITINLGDTVIFTIGSNHNSMEVDSATWAVNGNTPMSGGFSTPFGGDTVFPADLTVGKHYYVCRPHASMGMKGIITVNPSSTVGIFTANLTNTISIFPNPTNGNFSLEINDFTSSSKWTAKILTVEGKQIQHLNLTNSKTNFNLSEYEKGIYILQISDGKALLTKEIVIK